MQYDFDTIYNRKNTGSLKWDCKDNTFSGQEVLPMWIADMDFLAPYAVTEAIGQRNLLIKVKPKMLKI